MTFLNFLQTKNLHFPCAQHEIFDAFFSIFCRPKSSIFVYTYANNWLFGEPNLGPAIQNINFISCFKKKNFFQMSLGWLISISMVSMMEHSNDSGHCRSMGAHTEPAKKNPPEVNLGNFLTRVHLDALRTFIYNAKIAQFCIFRPRPAPQSGQTYFLSITWKFYHNSNLGKVSGFRKPSNHHFSQI